MLGLLFALSFVNYILRNNISVAQPAIAGEFSLSATEFGWILASFNVAYALFQIPGGSWTDRRGVRYALTLMAVTWGVLTVCTGFVPSLFAASTTGALVALAAVRFLMGVSHAPMFTGAAGAIGNWFPRNAWAFSNASLTAGLTLAQATLGPLVTWLIIAYGWRASFYLLSPLAFVSAALWWWFVRDKPRQHPLVSTDEMKLIESGHDASGAPSAGPTNLRAVLRERNLMLLAAAYFSMNYVFYMFAQWLYEYLVEARGFTLLQSGWLYALPFIVGAALAMAGGYICDALCKRIGVTWGCRLPAVFGLSLVAILLLAGVNAGNAYTAVVLLALCFGFTQFTEGAFWSAATHAGGSQTATAGGVMNTGGNLVGVLAPAMGWMVDHFGWLIAFASGSFFAMLAAVLWLFVRFDESGADVELGRHGSGHL
jgi:ACS family glucarate transporter-like MFS transporter